MKTLKIIILGLFLTILLSSYKKNKTYEVKGIVYKDCSMIPAEGMTVRLANKHYTGTIKETVDVTTKVNRDGTFSIKYQNAGGGPLTLSVLPNEEFHLNQDVGEVITENITSIKIKANNYLTNQDTLFYDINADGTVLGGLEARRDSILGPFNDTTLS